MVRSRGDDEDPSDPERLGERSARGDPNRGFYAEDARHRTLIAYTMYLGFFSVAHGQPHPVPRSGPDLDSYVETLLQILTRR